MSLLDVSGLWIRRNGFTLGTVDISVSEGECLVVGGPNGSGKSTLLGGLGGYIPVMPGTRMSVLGKQLKVGEKGAFGWKSILPGFGVQIQGSRLFNDLTVEEHILFFANIYGASLEKYMALVSRCPSLQDRLDTRYGALSEGMRQALHFILSIGHNPRLLILDEPTSGLDESNQGWILRCLHDFMSQGGGVVLSTHDPMDVDALATSLLVLDKGKQVLYTSTSQHREAIGYASRLTIEFPSTLHKAEAEKLVTSLEGTIHAKARETTNDIKLFSKMTPEKCSRDVMALGEGWLVREARATSLGDAFELFCRGESP